MNRLRLTVVAGGIALGLIQSLLVGQHSAAADTGYRVRSGDTLWGISERLHVSIAALVKYNHIADPNLIYVDQTIRVPQATRLHARRTVSAQSHDLSRDAAKRYLLQAAHDQNLKPAFIEAVAWWESGWDQDAVSPDGAIGIMQVMPSTGAWAGPALLGRHVDLHNPADNTEVGAALLAYYYDEFHGDRRKVLAAYYQGAWSVQHHGIYKSSHRYVDGILALEKTIQGGDFPY